jgi:hypothetical protein
LRKDQTVFEMAEEVLTRQAKSLAAQTGQSFASALEAVANTYAGRQLRQLANGEYRDEKAADWQDSLPWKRAKERHYHSSWLESYIEQLEGTQARAEHHALLEDLASLRG